MEDNIRQGYHRGDQHFPRRLRQWFRGGPLRFPHRRVSLHLRGAWRTAPHRSQQTRRDLIKHKSPKGKNTTAAKIPEAGQSIYHDGTGRTIENLPKGPNLVFSTCPYRSHCDDSSLGVV